MNQIKVNQSQEVKLKLDSYPKGVRGKLDNLRRLVLNTAAEIETIDEIEETLKWGEPSYIVKKGSTIRMDWKPRSPQQYAFYFSCSTSLVETFRIIYGDLFRYEKNRAILFDLSDEIPETELKECIAMALQYHTLKNKPFLGN